MKNITKLYRLSKNWVNKEYEVKKDISYTNLLKLVVVVTPMYSLAYLNTFYGQFGIKYFIYFNTLDFLHVIYKNIYPLIVTLIACSFLILLAGASQQIEKNKWNKILIVGVTTCLFIYILNSDEYLFKHIDDNVLWIGFLGILGVIWSIAVVKSLRFLIGAFLFIFLVSSFTQANYDFFMISQAKPSFDIILTDTTKLLEKDSSKGSYYIGNTTSYIFIFDGGLGKIRAVSRNEISEFRFPKKKHIDSLYLE